MLNACYRPFVGCLSLPSTVARCIAIPVRQNAYRCAISKIHRLKYVRRYMITVLNPDGSTIQIRAPEPRYFVQLPVDINSLSESERRQRLAARKKKTVKVKEESIDDNFDSDQYTSFWTDNIKKRE